MVGHVLHNLPYRTMRFLKHVCMLLLKVMKIRAVEDKMASSPTALVAQNMHLRKCLGTLGCHVLKSLTVPVLLGRFCHRTTTQMECCTKPKLHEDASQMVDFF